MEDVKIFVDHRELRTPVVRHLYEKDVLIETCTLEVGDFILSNDVVVELKKAPDFVNSLVDGRLFVQARALRQEFNKPLYIIEGDLQEIFETRNVHSNAIRAAMVSLVLNFSIPFLFSRNTEETAELLTLIARREQIENNKEVSLRGSRRTWSLSEQQQYLIEGLPAVGPKLAKSLLSEFGSPAALLNADADALKKVPKMGPKKAKSIRRIIETKYDAAT